MELWVRTAADYLHDREGLGCDWLYHTHKRAGDGSWLFCFRRQSRPGVPTDFEAFNVTEPELRQLERVKV